MVEIWKKIDGFSYYEVSNFGKIRSWKGRGQYGKKLSEPILKKTFVGIDGYPFVKLQQNGKRTNYRIHKLVLEAFVGKRPNRMQARHLDGNRSNNDINNLKWGTCKENQADRLLHGTSSRGEHYNNKILRVNNVGKVKLLNKIFGIFVGIISRIEYRTLWGWLEIWKGVEEYYGYEVSNMGRVRCWNPRNRHAKPPRKARILKLTKSRGYPTVKLSNNGKRETFQIHSLVLTAFIGERPENMQGRHLDGNPENNVLFNLVWGTISENQRDRIRHNTHLHGERHVNHKLTEKNVVKIKYLLKAKAKSSAKIGKLFGVSGSTIEAIKREANWGWLKI